MADYQIIEKHLSDQNRAYRRTHAGIVSARIEVAGQRQSRTIGDQRVGGKRAPLIGPQRLALPFGGLAVGRVEPYAWDRDLTTGPKLPVSDRSRLPCR
ncbi:MAG: hypothetical protein KGL35_04405 [Bradyrhizobium sp.]|nr:hypothetical protein [Pseudomonadota bacterium]MDE2066629.1 hypothetical protein [Bradyrhizobium sp.]MDE2467986.1 hypothetical protein [Bradyrhizobium sp.]